jgi:hypothetical protein
MSSKTIFRQGAEVLAIIIIALGFQLILAKGLLTSMQACWVVAMLALLKTVFFLTETLHHLLTATRKNAPYHRFMALMIVNMAQVALSFGLDYWCLYTAMPSSFEGIKDTLHGAELVFECCYLSFLNITYFGYGDITPQIVPAKLVTMMELLIAFFTFIFLLSDFISLKEAIQKEEL